VEDPRRRGLDVVVVADDRRRLAAELERDGREAFGGRTHDGAAGVGGAGENDVVVRQRREVLRAYPGKNRDRVLREYGADLLREEPTEVARVRRHLDHAAIAGGERARERA